MNERESRIVIIGVVGILLACVLFYAAITYRSATQVKVTRLTWMRAINIERWLTVQESNWGIPQGGREIRNYRAIHHWDHIMTGSHQNCSGTGSNRTCTTVYDYTDYPVYRDKYDYWIERWVVVREPKNEGTNNSPSWPDVSDLKTSPTLTIGDERTGMQTSRYTVEFTGDYALDITEERWRAFRPGQRATLILNIFKQPMDVQS